MERAAEFLALYAAVYAVSLALYFGVGSLILWINARHPERRIQKHRDGLGRARIEILQSLKYLAAAALCLTGGVFFQMQGWTLIAPYELSVWSVLGMGLVSIFAYDTWLYWAHRALHLKALYKHHLPHHRSVAPTVWSNDSASVVEAFVMHSFFFLAPLVLPIPTLVLVGHRIWDHVNGQIGHSGFEYFASSQTRYPSPMVCTTYHDQHHEHFNYNFANFFSFWDRVCGTLHPEYDRKVREFERLGAPSGSPSGSPDGAKTEA